LRIKCRRHYINIEENKNISNIQFEFEFNKNLYNLLFYNYIMEFINYVLIFCFIIIIFIKFKENYGKKYIIEDFLKNIDYAKEITRQYVFYNSNPKKDTQMQNLIDFVKKISNSREEINTCNTKIIMEIFEIKNNKSIECNYVPLIDIKKEKDIITKQNIIVPKIPNDNIIKIYFILLGGLGIYLLYKLMRKF
jgi:hypothetical protein